MRRRGGRSIAAALLAFSLTVGKPALADDTAGAISTGAARLHLSELRLHAFYRDSGSLSADLLHGDSPPATWNLAIGGGGLDGPADDVVVILAIAADKDAAGSGEVFSDVPITIRVRDKAGRSLGHRTVNGILTSSGGAGHLALWLTDLTCVGPITIDAAMGRQRREARYEFNCGE